MFLNVNFRYVPDFFSALSHYSPSVSYVQDLITRIKNIVYKIFTRVTEFNRNMEKYRQANLKTVAMVSCVCLIILLAISIFRRREGGNYFPPTPPRLLRSPSRLFQ